jgi:hypothetical protein
VPNPKFVEIYNPTLGNARYMAPYQAVDDWAAEGWLVVDGVTPTPTAQFLTPAAGDARYAKVGDLPTPVQIAAQLDLADVATSGLYEDLVDKPDIPTALSLASSNELKAAFVPRSEYVAGGGSSGPDLTPDPTYPGLYVLAAGSSLTPDAANPGLYLIGA